MEYDNDDDDMWEGVERRQHQSYKWTGPDRRQEQTDMDSCSFIGNKQSHDQQFQHYICEKEAEIGLIIYQLKNIHDFIEQSKPLLEFVEIELESKKERKKLYSKLTEQVLGWAIIAFLTYIGAWTWEHIGKTINIK